MVLTLDRNGRFGGRIWPDVTEAYREIGRLSRATKGRIGRLWGSETRLERSGRSRELRTVRALGSRWYETVEAHRSGWPHVNVVFYCPELAALLRAEQRERLADPEVADAVAEQSALRKAKQPVSSEVRRLARQAILVGGELRDVIVRSGWGIQSTAESARDLDALNSYGVKLAGLHDASLAEVAKITQAPLAAPQRFRRLRSGKGFLPPRRKNPDYTGVLIRRRRAPEGDWTIQAINAPKDESTWPAIELARQVEWQCIEEEERIRARNRGELVPLPPVRHSRRGELEPHQVTSELTAAMSARARALSD